MVCNFNVQPNNPTWRCQQGTAVHFFARYQKHWKYSARPGCNWIGHQEGSISSGSSLGSNLSFYPGTSKCSRVGMASIFRQMEADLDNPTRGFKHMQWAHRGLCKCTKANLPCTTLCACNGNSYQDLKKKLSSKILPVKTFNCLAFTARKNYVQKTVG